MNIPLFDSHCDTISAALERGEGLRKNGLHIDLERGAAYRPYAQFFAIWSRRLPPGHVGGYNYSKPDLPRVALLSQYRQTKTRLLRALEENRDLVKLCRSSEQVRQAAEEGRVAALISVEGAELMDCSLEVLREEARDGVRMVNLTWNYDNELAGSALGASQSGLSPLGREYLRGAQELGVILDVSHLSQRAFWDCAGLSRAPIVASHSNAQALCPHPRNLTDDQFKAIVALGGYAGLNFCPDFLGGREDLAAIADHAEHFLSLGGEKALGIGSDFDGIDALPRGMRGIEDTGALYNELLRRNFNEGLVRDIFYNNVMRVVDSVI